MRPESQAGSRRVVAVLEGLRPRDLGGCRRQAQPPSREEQFVFGRQGFGAHAQVEAGAVAQVVVGRFQYERLPRLGEGLEALEPRLLAQLTPEAGGGAELVRREPNNKVYAEAARILRAKLDAGP